MNKDYETLLGQVTDALRDSFLKAFNVDVKVEKYKMQSIFHIYSKEGVLLTSLEMNRFNGEAFTLYETRHNLWMPIVLPIGIPNSLLSDDTLVKEKLASILSDINIILEEFFIKRERVLNQECTELSEKRDGYRSAIIVNKDESCTQNI